LPPPLWRHLGMDPNQHDRFVHERYLRRLAVKVVSELPSDEADCRTVLAYAREIIDRFIAQPAPEPAEGNVVTLPRGGLLTALTASAITFVILMNDMGDWSWLPDTIA
jgi:hypothetical protein